MEVAEAGDRAGRRNGIARGSLVPVPSHNCWTPRATRPSNFKI